MSKRTALLVLISLILLLIVFLSVCLFLPKPASNTSALVRDTATTVEKNHNPARNPINFKKLQQRNPDICAWIYIPNSSINGPILQHEADPDFYLTHSFDGVEDSDGALYIQSNYSSNDFDDSVSIVYGRRTGVFGRLEMMYTENQAFEKYSKLYLYTPDCTFTYQVFGASAYESKHILKSYGRFQNTEDILKFVDSVMDYRTLFHQFDDSVTVVNEDRLLVLSTGLKQSTDQRYLVLAKLADEAN